MKPVKLGKAIEAATNLMIGSRNGLVQKLNVQYRSVPPPGRSVLASKTGAVVDIEQVADVVRAVDYKTVYLAVSLRYLRNRDREIVRAFKKGNPFANQARLTQNILLHTDVYFTLAFSSLEIASWILHLVYGTKLRPRDVSFYNVATVLNKSHPTGTPFGQFVNDYKTGWLLEFNRYRHFVTHYGTLQTRGGFRWTQARGMKPKRLLIPDDPTVYPPEYTKQLELVDYCMESFKRLLAELAQVYDAALLLV